MGFVRVARAEFLKYFLQQFVSFRTAFWFLILPFGNGLLFYSIYLPFTDHLVPLSAPGFNLVVDIVGFTLTGQLIYSFFVGMIVAGAQFDYERFQGTFESMLLTPASRIAILTGNLAATAAQYLWLIAGALIAFLIFFRLPVVINDPLALVLSVITTYTSLLSLGICLEALFVYTRKGGTLGTMLQEPIAFVSGTVVPTSAFPSYLAQLTYLLPLTVGLIAVRLTLLAGASLHDVLPLIAGLAMATVVLGFLGKWLISRAEASAKSKGTLGLF